MNGNNSFDVVESKAIKYNKDIRVEQCSVWGTSRMFLKEVMPNKISTWCACVVGCERKREKEIVFLVWDNFLKKGTSP